MAEVNELTKQFDEMCKMTRWMGDKSKKQALMQRMQQAQQAQGVRR